jgi:hypothetical protein
MVFFEAIVKAKAYIRVRAPVNCLLSLVLPDDANLTSSLGLSFFFQLGGFSL